MSCFKTSTKGEQSLPTKSPKIKTELVVKNFAKSAKFSLVLNE